MKGYDDDLLEIYDDFWQYGRKLADLYACRVI
jgi:hypothetical protein